MDDLILKYLQKQCSDAEKTALFDWMALQPANQLYFDQMRKLWDLNTISNSPDLPQEKIQAAYSELRDQIKSTQNLITMFASSNSLPMRLLRIAAVVLISFGISWIYFTNKDEDNVIAENCIEVPVGQRVLLSLSDGSKVWLNSKSKITYPEKFSKNSRVVKLDGEALFDVAHDAEHPFIVETSKLNIEVKGTEFNVYAYSGEGIIETTLLKGKVILSKENSTNHLYEMKPNQMAVFNTNSQDLKIIEKAEVDVITSWKDGVYYFKDIILRDLITRLSHYYDIKFTVKYDKLLDYNCTGKFRNDESITDILNVIKTSIPFKYKLKENEIVIYK